MYLKKSIYLSKNKNLSILGTAAEKSILLEHVAGVKRCQAAVMSTAQLVQQHVAQLVAARQQLDAQRLALHQHLSAITSMLTPELQKDANSFERNLTNSLKGVNAMNGNAVNFSMNNTVSPTTLSQTNFSTNPVKINEIVGLGSNISSQLVQERVTTSAAVNAKAQTLNVSNLAGFSKATALPENLGGKNVLNDIQHANNKAETRMINLGIPINSSITIDPNSSLASGIQSQGNIADVTITHQNVHNGQNQNVQNQTGQNQNGQNQNGQNQNVTFPASNFVSNPTNSLVSNTTNSLVSSNNSSSLMKEALVNAGEGVQLVRIENTNMPTCYDALSIKGLDNRQLIDSKGARVSLTEPSPVNSIASTQAPFLPFPNSNLQFPIQNSASVSLSQNLTSKNPLAGNTFKGNFTEVKSGFEAIQPRVTTQSAQKFQTPLLTKNITSSSNQTSNHTSHPITASNAPGFVPNIQTMTSNSSGVKNYPIDLSAIKLTLSQSNQAKPTPNDNIIQHIQSNQAKPTLNDNIIQQIPAPPTTLMQNVTASATPSTGRSLGIPLSNSSLTISHLAVTPQVPPLPSSSQITSSTPLSYTLLKQNSLQSPISPSVQGLSDPSPTLSPIEMKSSPVNNPQPTGINKPCIPSSSPSFTTPQHNTSYTTPQGMISSNNNNTVPSKTHAVYKSPAVPPSTAIKHGNLISTDSKSVPNITNASQIPSQIPSETTDAVYYVHQVDVKKSDASLMESSATGPLKQNSHRPAPASAYHLATHMTTKKTKHHSGKYSSARIGSSIAAISAAQDFQPSTASSGVIKKSPSSHHSSTGKINGASSVMSTIYKPAHLPTVKSSVKLNEDLHQIQSKAAATRIATGVSGNILASSNGKTVSAPPNKLQQQQQHHHQSSVPGTSGALVPKAQKSSKNPAVTFTPYTTSSKSSQSKLQTWH